MANELPFWIDTHLLVSVVNFMFGYCAVCLYDRAKHSVALADRAVISNRGSRLNYMFWNVIITAVYSLIFSFGFTGWILFGMLSFANGATVGYVTIWRAQDAGRTFWFVFVGLVPILNYWVMFANPKIDNQRPDYEPENIYVRFGLTLLLFVILHALMMWPALLELQF